jgi:choline dehydrogenase-like flavoprotein
MLIDLARTRPDFSMTEFDACIIGGGVAGITIAVKLGRAGRRVILIEAGGQKISAKSQAYYRGKVGRLKNLSTDVTRIRALGGSSNHWGGWCRPLDSNDFEGSKSFREGAWPIRRSDLDPHFWEAAKILGVNEVSGVESELPNSDGNLQTIKMYFSTPPAHLGANYLKELRESKNVVLMVNAPYLSATLNPHSDAINSIAVHDSRANVSISCRAHQFVFAMGTIENVRHLLILKRNSGDRFRNIWSDLGRYYMQHLHQELGYFVLRGDAKPAFASGVHERIFMASTEKYLRHTGRGAFRIYSTNLSNCSALIDYFRNVLTGEPCKSAASAGTTSITCEQVPIAGSRIVLVDEDDELGQPRIQLDWRISSADRMTMLGAALEFGRFLIRADIGRFKINPVILSSANPLTGATVLPGALGAAGHQMGGARMGSRGNGIVDRDCRAWGLTNLYVAGSAVFRTCGHATPTLTLTQLALRLADTLNRRLAG